MTQNHTEYIGVWTIGLTNNTSDVMGIVHSFPTCVKHGIIKLKKIKLN